MGTNDTFGGYVAALRDQSMAVAAMSVVPGVEFSGHVVSASFIRAGKAEAFWLYFMKH